LIFSKKEVFSEPEIFSTVRLHCENWLTQVHKENTGDNIGVDNATLPTTGDAAHHLRTKMRQLQQLDLTTTSDNKHTHTHKLDARQSRTPAHPALQLATCVHIHY